MKITQEEKDLLKRIQWGMTNPNHIQSPYGTITTLRMVVDNQTPAQKLRMQADEVERKEKDFIAFIHLVNKLTT